MSSYNSKHNGYWCQDCEHYHNMMQEDCCHKIVINRQIEDASRVRNYLKQDNVAHNQGYIQILSNYLKTLKSNNYQHVDYFPE